MVPHAFLNRFDVLAPTSDPVRLERRMRQLEMALHAAESTIVSLQARLDANMQLLDCYREELRERIGPTTAAAAVAARAVSKPDWKQPEEHP